MLNTSVMNLHEHNVFDFDFFFYFFGERVDMKGGLSAVRSDLRIIGPDPKCGQAEQTIIERRHQHWQQPSINEQLQAKSATI